jgi:hypothetical protein
MMAPQMQNAQQRPGLTYAQIPQMDTDIATIERDIKIQELRIENQKALIARIKQGGNAQPAPMQVQV